jgi:penicillin-binding protein 2
VQIKDHLREGIAFTNRAIVAGLLVIVALLVLLARLAQLQIAEHEHFTTLSKDNRVKLVPLPPTRGLIYDRNGVLLAENRPAYSLEMVPEQAQDIEDTLQRLAGIIEISEVDLERFNRLKQRKRRFDSVPIRTNISIEEAARFAVHRHRFPGLDIKAQLLRHYPYREETSHVVGYVGRVSKRDLEHIDASNYAGTSHMGKTGVEKSYEAVLHGAVGVQQVEVNSVGRVARVLEHEPPLPGQDLHLHLDIDLQRVGLEALGEHNGAVVALDPDTGGVLALVSKPGFDPNLFVEGISSKAYNALQQDPNRPLYDRALRGQYPPGSTVKQFIGLAGLETGHITFDTSVYCPGFYRLPGHQHRYRDWKRTGHGPMDLDAAITQSCDVFYYKLAHEMGVDALSSYLQHFNFGEQTGIDLQGEARGILPSREWKRRNRRQPWYPGETVIMGIGQGYFLSTPLQLAAATAAIANGGTFYTPRLVDYLESRGERKVRSPIPPNGETIPIVKPEHWDDVRTAMLHVTEGLRGTAKRIRTEHYRIAGKTGTAQVFTLGQDEEYDEDAISRKHRDHALFVAYAPAEDPQIAVAVIAENGGSGSGTAAPIARKVLDAYLLPRLGIDPEAVAEENTPAVVPEDEE